MSSTAEDLLCEVLTAYLVPLIQKHERGQVVLHEDLLQSLEASQAVLGSNHNENKKQDREAVSKRVMDLHESQLKAYEEAARKEWKRHCQTLLENNSLAKQDRPLLEALLASKKSDWKVDERVWQQVCEAVLQEQNIKTVPQQPQQEPGETPTSVDATPPSVEEPEEATPDKEEGEQEQGMETEEPVTDEGVGATATETTATEIAASGPPPLKAKELPAKKVPKKRVSGTAAKKTLVKKRVGGTKPAQRGGRARRGGRGGANAAK